MSSAMAFPPDKLDSALTMFGDVQECRVRAMFNRSRAVFAEFLVAALLPGAEVVLDPAAAWDIRWPHPRTGVTVRIQVKCSGEFLPRRPDDPAPPRWDMKAPQRGYDMETRTIFGPGHQCELFVLARHEGQAIDSGWTFAVARLDQLADRKRVTPAHLTELRINLVPAEQLEAAAGAALTSA